MRAFKTIHDTLNKDTSVFRKQESNWYANGSNVFKKKNTTTTRQKDSVKIGHCKLFVYM